MASIPPFDSSQHYLGKLCKRSHDWHGTGHSLRKTRNRTCLECERVLDRERSARGRGRDRNASRRAITNKIKMDRGCADCGYREHPAALEFDHLPGTEKRWTIARATFLLPLDQLLEEIEKCEVVCANCHAIRTASRRQRS